ncbi:MAG TPA: hypothetical protein DC046_12185 [Rhodospirillaceae bacterium]|nr:hypothetical protein [Rhodospirillaceae bacterium]
MSFDSSILYELSGREFVGLVAEVLSTQGYTDVKITDGPIDQGIDIQATRDGKKVAIEVKHRRSLSDGAIARIISKIEESDFAPDEIGIVTSAEPSITSAGLKILSPLGKQVWLLGRQDLLDILSKNKGLGKEELEAGRYRLKRIVKMLKWSILPFAISASLFTYLEFQDRTTPSSDLSKSIQNVRATLQSIGALDRNLDAIKDEMEVIRKETVRLEARHMRAKELSKLSDEQRLAMREIVTEVPFTERILSYIAGFLIGVGASLASAFAWHILSRRVEWSKD